MGDGQIQQTKFLSWSGNRKTKNSKKPKQLGAPGSPRNGGPSNVHTTEPVLQAVQDPDKYDQAEEKALDYNPY